VSNVHSTSNVYRKSNANGNPTAAEAVTLYRRDLIAGSLPFTIGDARRELKGKDLFAGVNPALPVMQMC